MSVLDRIRERAKADLKHIVLAEGTEERTVQAAQRITEAGLARVTLVGRPDEVEAVAAKFSVRLDGVDVIDPVSSPDYKRYVDWFYELRKEKGVTPEKALAQIKDPLFFGAMLIKDGKADGMVAGAVSTTGNTLRLGFRPSRWPREYRPCRAALSWRSPTRPTGTTACSSSATAP